MALQRNTKNDCRLVILVWEEQEVIIYIWVFTVFTIDISAAWDAIIFATFLWFYTNTEHYWVL